MYKQTLFVQTNVVCTNKRCMYKQTLFVQTNVVHKITNEEKKMQTTYLSKHRDRLTLHVTCEIFQHFRNGTKSTEYRPVNGHYFKWFEKFRTMYRISPHYRLEVRIYEAYKGKYIDFVCTGITIKSLCECPPEVSRIYGTLYTAFYALHLVL